MPRLRIQIDADLFSAISDEEKAKITKILETTNLANEGVDFESSGVASGQAAIADPQGIFDGIGKSLCKIGCDTAATAAVAACSTLSGGVAIAVCIAAAEAAREVCRDAC
jgi:hypothetical protein